MIRITRQTDYGIVLMSQMVTCDDGGEGYLTASELAAQTDLTVPMVSKILKLLTRAELLISHRGAHGGYELAREPRDISVSDMIEALEGPIALTACVDESANECEHVSGCPTHGNWLTINRAIRGVLDGITLFDMVGEIKPTTLVGCGAGSCECGSGSCSTDSQEA